MAIRIGFCKWEHRTTTWVETLKTLDWYTGQFAGTPSATGEEKLGWCRRWRCSLQPTHWHLWFWDHRIIRVLNTSDPWLSEMRTGWFSGRFTYIETPKITQWWRSIYQKSPSDVGQYTRKPPSSHLGFWWNLWYEPKDTVTRRVVERWTRQRVTAAISGIGKHREKPIFLAYLYLIISIYNNNNSNNNHV